MYGPKNAQPSSNAAKKITVPELRARKQPLPNPRTLNGNDAVVPRIAMVTAYDVTMARLVDEAGVDMVLVGDSLGMVVQGLSTTIPVTLEEMAYHSRAVARGLSRAHLCTDLPFMTYQVSPSQAVESAGKLMKEGACESVKLEGGSEVAEHVHRIVRAGIPVVGHVGLTPQSVHALGGFKVQGRGDEASERIVRDALAIEAAGAFAIVLEAVPPDVAERISRALTIPTIGIGAGVHCDGQVLVCTDLLGMARGHSPKFAKRYDDLADRIVGAVQDYVGEVRTGAFPGAEHSYKANGPRPAAPSQPAEPISAIHATFDEPPSIDVDMWH
jgi:3-methyl-2-oxobutanoate hydroxymethyltransferase